MSKMKNVKIIKPNKGAGYFLTIGELEGEFPVENTWAVSALELLTLLKMLKPMEQELLEEIENIKKGA